MTKRLRTEAEIRIAGRAAVAGWRLTPKQVDQVVALITPVYSEVWHLLDADDAQCPAPREEAA